MSTPRIEAAQRLEEASIRALKPRPSDIRWQCLMFLVLAGFIGWQAGSGPGVSEWVTLPAILALPVVNGWISRRSKIQPRGVMGIATVAATASFAVALVSIFSRSREAREAGSLWWGLASAAPLLIGAAVYYWRGMRATR